MIFDPVSKFQAYLHLQRISKRLQFAILYQC